MSGLTNVRVLDLADDSGAYCGRLLADLGAEVVKVEPAHGDPARGIGPFFQDAQDGTHSLFFTHYNAGKQVRRGGPGEERALLANVDVVLVTGTPAECARRGWDYPRWRAQDPRLIVAAISPFGQSGPRAGWRSCDLVAQSIGGMAFVNGHAHEAPLRGFGLQAYHSAGVHAAIGIVLALLARARTGRGQLIDISLQEAVAATVEHVSGSYHLTGTIEQRRGSLHWTRAFRVGRCRDGYVMQTTLGDWPSLVEWLKSETDANGLDDPQYEAYAARQRDHQHIFDVLDTWIRAHDVEELVESAQLRRIPYAAVRSLTALIDDAQLRARGFFVKLPAERVEIPGPPFRLSSSPDFAAKPWEGEPPGEPLRRPALVDRSGSAGASPSQLWGGSSLSGVRVLDFTWVVAGPVATRVLADHGADVIKVERRDATDFGSRRAGLTGNLNRGKRSIVINMADPRGVAIARALVRQSDVVVDNFSARVMRNWGFDYEHLRAIKADIIALSMSGFGHTGPLADHVSYGPTLQALTGFSLHMRHAAGEPAGWGYSYSDMIAGYAGALAAVAALWQRTQTGEGQHVDLSQLEALTAMIGVPLLELVANGTMSAPAGNRSMEQPAAPHGIYRCRDRDDDGDVRDRWCAIAVFGDEEWSRFVTALGNPAWCSAAEFRSAAAREQHHDALNARVEEWTRTRTTEEVMARLQAAGIAAGIVANGRDLCERDEHLAARGYWTRLPTPEGEAVKVDGVAARLSETPGHIRAAAPLLGENTDVILADLLSLSQNEIDQLRRDQVVA